MAHEVFISHSTIDKAVSDAVCATLENGGIRCWVAPRDVQAGRSFAGEITRAIQESKIMVLIFSAHSNNSEQVLREVQLAVKARLHIIQFRIEDVRLNDDLEYFLSTPHWLDALAPPLENHLRRLETSIKTLLDSPTIEREPRQIIPGARLLPVRARRSTKVWISIGTGLGAGLIVTAFLLKSPKPAQERSLPEGQATPVASTNLPSRPDTANAKRSRSGISRGRYSYRPGHTVGALPYLHRCGMSVIDINRPDRKSS